MAVTGERRKKGRRLKMNMFGRKWTSCLISGVLMLSLAAGCGNAEAEGSGSNQSLSDSFETDKTQTTTDAGKATEGSESNEDHLKYNVTWDDMAEITVLFDSMGPVPTGVDAVEAKINEITEKEINTHVNIEIYEIGSYDQQVGLMMSSGEPVDLMLTLPGGSSSFTTMRSQGQLQDISELLEEYGQPVLDTVGDLLQATTVNGGVYAVPTYADAASFAWIVMRTDVLEDLGLLEKAENMTSMDEFEEILDAVAKSEKWNYLAPTGGVRGNLIFTTGGACIGENNFSDMTSFDLLGDNLSLVAVPANGGDGKVQLTYATDEYRKMYERVRGWYEKGYVYKDSVTEQDAQLIKNNVVFSAIMDGESNIDAAQEAQCEMPVTCVKLVSYPIRTGSCLKFTWGVPSTAKEAEAAVTFLSMMYTDSRIANLLSWGIEGVDYEVTEGVAHYIEGNETPAYHMNDYQFGNQFIVWPWEGSSADFRETSKALTDSTPRSDYFGFVCDTSSITNEIAAVTGVLSQYRGQIETGMADEEILDEFLEKLNTSGADKIVSCYQEQLDAWMTQQQNNEK